MEMPRMVLGGWFYQKDVVRITGLSVPQIQRLVKQNAIVTKKLTPTGRTLYQAADIQRMMAN